MKQVADKKSRVRMFARGDKVLVLLPVVGDPFKARFSGLYQIEEKLSQVNYLVKMPDRKKLYQICHVNMLKPYDDRDRELEKQVFITASQ
eukprot:g22204.t1